MKNIICILICIISLTKTYAQNTSEVSQFKTVVLNSGTVAYYSMLSDNSVWYATSGETWSKSATTGLPK